MSFLRLVVPSPLRRSFDYLPPEGWSAEALARLPNGVRVKVPFGRRSCCGILVGQVAESAVAAERLRRALEVLDSEPVIAAPLLALCQWAAEYYQHPPGEILGAALPPSLRRGKSPAPAGEAGWRLTPAGHGMPDGAPARAPGQARLLGLLRERGPCSRSALREAGISPAVLREVRRKGLIEQARLPLRQRQPQGRPGPPLNEQQRDAVRLIARHSGFHCLLLEGVTGSGKTEVYLHAIADVLERGRQALVLIPEIGLTPQTLQRFQRRFDARIAVLHSGLSDSARERAWDSARSGRAHIVLGTRSAVFCGLAAPGLIVVDEEHDLSYKQQDGFRYSARDVAVMRGRLEDVPVVLGSATPSLETQANAAAGKYRLARLTGRAGLASMPEFRVLDIRGQPLRGGLGESMVGAIGEHLGRGNQVLLFLNRRGYAPCLQCHDCGHIAECIHCDARLTYHRRAAQLRCHHCGWHRAASARCPDCASGQLMARGLGTERLEETLGQLFPGGPIFRVDRDSMARRGAMERVFQQVSEGRPCILLGTQMLTKGHHFPSVTLVCLVDVDSALFSGDFRGAERMGQLLTQVAGRAGRGRQPGLVLLQTHYPGNPLLRALLERGYGGFSRDLLRQRLAVGMPPYGFLLLLRADASRPEAGEDFLALLRQRFETEGGAEGLCVGPLPAPMQRRQGRFRWQLMVRSATRGAARQCAARLVAIAERLPRGQLRWSVDVDPQDML